MSNINNMVEDILRNEFNSIKCNDTTKKLNLACKATMEQFEGTYLEPSIGTYNKAIIRIISFNKDSIGEIELEL